MGSVALTWYEPVWPVTTSIGPEIPDTAGGSTDDATVVSDAEAELVTGPPKVPWDVAVQVAVYVPAAGGVTQLAVPRMTLQVFVGALVHGTFWAPVNCEGVTVPAVTPTATERTVVDPIIDGASPSARQVTCTVAPAATSPEGAVIVAVTVAPARLLVGYAASNANDA
ncbi:hypothetical protein [Anaeromyxobacter oryzisoli]|uniref:hypothetical protein n=1 Tax=Anaeromyxobacter oryzisoli TaxID=2925408 RepID=UPI001F59F7C4|nr:hypothetical protein [Anaeromyxobacter sp. SG63]